VTISNLGNGPVEITGVTLTGSDSGDFTNDSTPPYTLAPQDVIVINVSYLPSSEGKSTATLEIATDSSPTP